MNITKLSFHQFRGIHEATLLCDPSLNVFVGNNGAGKSAVLDGLAMLLSWLLSRVADKNAHGQHMRDMDISNGASVAKLEAWCQTSATTLPGSGSSSELYWRLVKSLSGRAQAKDSSDLQQLNTYSAALRDAMRDSHGQTALPLLVYYPVHRAVHDIPLRIRTKHSFDLLAAYDNALESGSDFRLFFEWFREREDLENEMLRRTLPLFGDPALASHPLPDLATFEDRQLQAVRRALAAFLPDFRNLTVRRKPLRMEVYKHGQLLRFEQLSDGEKCLIALISDIARRLALANPNQDPLQGAGVVLIDEVDLHLHPQWQRLLISHLTEVFPRCQFFITTHSPHVLSHVQPHNVFMLERDHATVHVSKPTNSYGQSAEPILEDIMGLDTTRPFKVAEDLEAVFDSIAQGDWDEARARIQALEAILGQDPTLLRAKMLLRRKTSIRS